MHKPQTAVGYPGKLFLSPAEVAAELRVSTSTILRLIHADKLPAIAVSERIYRIPAASFEMFKAGTLPSLEGLEEAPLGPVLPGSAPSLGEGEPLPAARRRELALPG
jgi:excisionase family DNA binding protein